MVADPVGRKHDLSQTPEWRKDALQPPDLIKTSTTLRASNMAHTQNAGGKCIEREWWWLGWSQELPVSSDQWMRYKPAVEHHLSAS